MTVNRRQPKYPQPFPHHILDYPDVPALKGFSAMPSIPGNLHETIFLTVREATERLPVQAECLRDWIREGIVPASKCGRSFMIPSKAIDVVLRYGTDVIRAQLRFGVDDRARAGEPDLETEVREAAARARARLVVAKARLRQAHRKDLAALDAELPPNQNAPADPFGEIRELNPLRIALTIGELGSRPLNSMTDTEIFELARRLKMLTTIPAVVEEPALRGPHGFTLEPGNNNHIAPSPPTSWPPPPPPPA